MRIVCLMIAALALGGCAVTSSTALLDGPPRSVGCRSQLGAYYLSKTTLKITAKQYSMAINGRAPEVWSELDVKQTPGVADRRAGYCLDFLASPTSKDVIEVKRDAQGVLEEVNSDAYDKSKDIAQTLVQAIFTGIVDGPFDPTFTQVSPAAAGDRKLEQEFDAEYDPADGHQAGLVNNRLRDFGLCLLMHPRSCLNLPTAYCDDPLAHTPRKRAGGREGAPAVGSDSGTRFVDYRNGLLYRPRRPAKYCLLQRAKGGGWQLAKERAVEIENASPVFSIGVDRTFFADRETRLFFDKGVLKNVRIKKDSELVGFVTIPLQIANSIVALPANIIQIRVVDLDNRKKLQAAETALLQAQLELEGALNAYEAALAKPQ